MGLMSQHRFSFDLSLTRYNLKAKMTIANRTTSWATPSTFVSIVRIKLALMKAVRVFIANTIYATKYFGLSY